MVRLPLRTYTPYVPEPEIRDRLITTLSAATVTPPLMSAPSITVPALVMSAPLIDFSVVPAGTPAEGAPEGAMTPAVVFPGSAAAPVALVVGGTERTAF